MGAVQEEFLTKAATAARAAGHLFPEYAACEAALESGWGMSHLAAEANNLFGQKQAHPPLAGTDTVSLPTREYLHGAWVSADIEYRPGRQNTVADFLFTTTRSGAERPQRATKHHRGGRMG